MRRVRQHDVVARPPRVGAALLQHRDGGGVVTLQRRDVPVDAQRFRPLRVRFGVERERAVEPVAAFAEHPAARPVEPERRGQPETGPELPRFGQAVVQRGPQVRVLQAGPPEDVRLLRAEPRALAPLGDVEVVVAHPPQHRRRLAGPGQLVAAELPQWFQQPEPLPVAVGLADQHRLLHQPGEPAPQLGGGQPRTGADALGRRQVEAAREHRRPRPQVPFGRAAQREAPLDGGAQRLVPRLATALDRAGQPEAVAQPGFQLRQRQHPQPDRGQLDGQRDPGQQAADRADPLLVLLGDRELRVDRGRALGEQRQRRVAQPGPAGQRAARGRHRQRRDRPQVLAGQREPFPAGREQPEPGRGPQQVVGQRGAGVEEVLAVVEDHQRPALPQVLGEHARRAPAGFVVHAQRLEHGVRHERGVLQPGELDQPDAVGERAGQPGGGLHGQPRLADPARAGQRDQPRPRQQVLDLGHVGLASHETRAVRGQVAPLEPRAGLAHD